MKIFATSDIHGNKQIVSNLVTAYENSDADLLLICGDIGGKSHRTLTIEEFGIKQREDYDYLTSELRQCTKPFYCLLGNDDWFDVDDDYCLSTGQTVGSIVAFDWVNFTPFNTNREANENKMGYELGKLNITTETLVMAHCPPYMAQDKILSGKHVGSKSVKKYIESNQPKIWLCGHIHEDFGISKLGNTLVVNCACDHLKDRLRGVVVDTETMDYNFIGL